MTGTAMALMVFAAGAVAYAGSPETKLTVYVRNNGLVPGAVLIHAEETASKIFAGIGVSLQWSSRKRADESEQPPVFVELATNTPENLRPESLAFARVGEGSHLTVFFDRIERTIYPKNGSWQPGG